MHRATSEDARAVERLVQVARCPQTVAAFCDQPELFPDDRSAKCLRFELNVLGAMCRGVLAKRLRCRRSGRKAFLDGATEPSSPGSRV